MIYLVAPYKYKENILMDEYAVDDQGIKDIIQQYSEEYYCASVKNFHINYETHKIYFKMKAEWDTEWEDCIYYLIPIKQINQT